MWAAPRRPWCSYMVAWATCGIPICNSTTSTTNESFSPIRWLVTVTPMIEKATLQGHVRDLACLLHVLGVGKPILVAWSYGVALALEYAKGHPTRAMMLTGGAAYGLTPSWEYPFLRLMVALRLYRFIPAGWVMRPLAKLAAFHPDSPDELVTEMLWANPLPRRRSAWQTVMNAFWGYDGRDSLGKIQCPVFVSHGPADRIVPIERARETAELLPEGQFFRMEKSGHAAPVERAEYYNQLLERLVTFSRDSQ